MRPAARSGGELLNSNLTEIMESIQGEGMLVGSRNVFLRFAGCNLHCSYCDTQSSFDEQSYCKISKCTGHGELWEQVPNPLSVNQIVNLIKNYKSRWISLTGGEPLLWADFIRESASGLKTLGYNILLETNGTLCEQLNLCLPFIDLISMDFKMPSATGVNNWDKHANFLQIANKKAVYVKIVIDTQVTMEEIEDAVKIIASVDNNIPLILQPVTPIGDIAPPNIDTLLDLQRICMNEIKDVRVMPQIHKIMGLI